MNVPETRLHLGCGQTYLQGYVNIDFPPAHHTVQTQSVADRYADLTRLSYPDSSVDEIRLHHVFEHFPRPVALGMLASWYRWLKPQGIIKIEVPDYRINGLISILPFIPRKLRYRAIRHIFGSHEAPWAIHCEGWSGAYLKEAFAAAGLEVVKIKRSHWRRIFNLTITGKKSEDTVSSIVQLERLDALLRQFLVDESESELRLLTYWKDQLRAQIQDSTDRG
jgi:hypothetical protein